MQNQKIIPMKYHPFQNSTTNAITIKIKGKTINKKGTSTSFNPSDSFNSIINTIHLSKLNFFFVMKELLFKIIFFSFKKINKKKIK